MNDEAGKAAYEKTIVSPTPFNHEFGARRLKEVKQIFDDQGVVFWLGSGTCLGCIRDGDFIAWDDEIDTASVIGMHGLDEANVYRVAEVFRENGFYPNISPNPRYVSVALVKDGLRVDWTCHRIVDGAAIEFPGINLPLRIFTHPVETQFIDERFLVPNPPEEYLRLKYGPEWRTPKGPGFEADVVSQVRGNANLGKWRKAQQLLTRGVLPRPTTIVKVFDREGKPVAGAEITVAGLGDSKTDNDGVAKFFVPSEACYAMVISYGAHREILYEEWLAPRANFAYHPGPIVTAEEHYKAGVRADALVRL